MNQAEFSLHPDEREIWRGDPVIAPVRTPLTWLFTLIGVSMFPVLIILAVIATTATGQQIPRVLGLVPLMILLDGGTLLLSPWFLKRPLRRLSYRITDQRVLILKKDKGERFHLLAGIPFSEITALKFKAGKAGYGYVQLKEGDKNTLYFLRFMLPPTALYNVENSEYVMQLIQSRRDRVFA